MCRPKPSATGNRGSDGQRARRVLSCTCSARLQKLHSKCWDLFHDELAGTQTADRISSHSAEKTSLQESPSPRRRRKVSQLLLCTAAGINSRKPSTSFGREFSTLTAVHAQPARFRVRPRYLDLRALQRVQPDIGAVAHRPATRPVTPGHLRQALFGLEPVIGSMRQLNPTTVFYKRLLDEVHDRIMEQNLPNLLELRQNDP